MSNKWAGVTFKMRDGEEETVSYLQPDDDMPEVVRLRREMFIESIKVAREQLGEGYVLSYYSGMAVDYLQCAEGSFRALNDALRKLDALKAVTTDDGQIDVDEVVRLVEFRKNVSQNIEYAEGALQRAKEAAAAP